MSDKRYIYFNPKKFQELRKRKGWSQQTLANRTGIEVSIIKAYENPKIKRGCQEKTFVRLVKEIRWKELKRVVREGENLGEQWEEKRKRSQPSKRAQEKPKIFPDALPAEPELEGRDDQLEGVKEQLFTDDKTNRFSLHGIPGVGKTALALKLVYDEEVKEHFDGILYAGLGRDGDVLAQLGNWAGQLGISDEALKELTTIEQRAERIRTEIGNRHMLLVADDIWTEKAAASFNIGIPTCVQLITTRSPRIAIKFAGERNIISVTKLTDDYGFKLLQNIAEKAVEADRVRAERLVEIVGGLPLALILIGKCLEVAASSGDQRAKWTMDQLLEEVEKRLSLAEPQSSRDRHPSLSEEEDISLTVVIQISDEFLGKEARGALRALSIFPSQPSTFSDEAALAVTAASKETIYELVDSGLLETDKHERYFLHQTITDYARDKRKKDAEVEGINGAVFERMADFYKDYLQAHQNEYKMIEDEQENITVALRGAVDSHHIEVAVDIVIDFFELLEGRGLYDFAYDVTQQVLRLEQDKGKSRNLSLLLRNKGRIERNRGNIEDAMESFLEGFSIAKKFEDKKAQAILSMSVGAICIDIGEYDDGKRYSQEGLSFARELELHEITSTLLSNLGIVAIHQGEFNSAEIYYQESLEFAHKSGNISKVISLLTNMASLTEHLGKYNKAKEYVLKAINLAKRIGRRKDLIFLFLSQGTIASQQGDHNQAEICFQKGWKLARELGDKQGIIYSLQNLGTLEVRRGNPSQAEEYLIDGLKQACEVEHHETMCTFLSTLGTVAAVLERFDQAEAYYDKSLRKARKFGLPWVESGILIEKGNAFGFTNSPFTI